MQKTKIETNEQTLKRNSESDEQKSLQERRKKKNYQINKIIYRHKRNVRKKAQAQPNVGKIK